MTNGLLRQTHARIYAGHAVAIAVLTMFSLVYPVAAQSGQDEDGSFEQHAATIDSDDARRLAERFSPVVTIREQPEPCDTTGEPYLPVPVDVVLGNPDVR